MAGDRKDPKIAYQLLLCPVVDIAHLDTESYALFGDGPWLSKANIEYYYDQYLRGPERRSHAYASPLLAKDLRDLPPRIL